MAVTSVYGLYNGSIKAPFNVKALEEYSNLFFKINLTDSAFVELLDAGDNVKYTAPVKNGIVELFNINPGDYYARVVIDANGNGKWDTGKYSKHRQPEEVYYYPKKLSLKKNWDIEQSWNIYELPLDSQKPMEIKKNKPKSYAPSKKDEDDEEDEFDTNFGNSFYTGNKYDDTRNSFNNNLKSNKRLNR